MSVAELTYDVFLAHTRSDAGIAGAIRQQFSDAGLNVFDVPADVTPASNVEIFIQSALAESDAVVVVLTPTSATASTLMLELGGAMAWHKPIYVVRDGVPLEGVPKFLRKFESYQSSEVADLANRLAKSRRPEPLTQDQRAYLGKAYQSLSVSLEELPERYFQLLFLKNAMNDEFGIDLTPERVMQELLRMRKKGQLSDV